MYTTVDTKDHAVDLARQAVNRRLAFCVNISQAESVYAWNNSLEQAQEYVMVMKTADSHLEALKEMILEAHPYECPAVFTWSVQANATYQQALSSYLHMTKE